MSEISWLDIGCETGSFLYYLRNKYPDMKLTGMDVIPELLEHLNDGIDGKKIIPFLGDITNEQKLPKGTFDIVSMTGVIQIFDEWEGVLRNALSLLNDKGVMYMLSVFNPEPYDVFVKYKPSNQSGGVLEAGWNMISLDSIKRYCEETDFVAEVIPFEINIDIPKNKDDTVRSWTIKKDDGKRMIINGLQLVNNHYIFRIRRR